MKRTLFLLCFLPLIIYSQKNSFGINYLVDFKNKNNSVSKAFELNINKDYSFISLSAYCFDKTKITTLYFRTSNNNIWSNWKQLKQDYESFCIDRNTYGLQLLNYELDKIQFKSNQIINNNINFRLFVSVENTKNELSPVKNIKNSDSCELPDNCDRDCWCINGDCSPQGTSPNTTPTHIIVHHSGNNYSNDTNYALVVQSIWDYHVNTNGWSDIGYNWLVDPNGVLYQGRGDNIQGAHFSCMNSQTMGVCVIGNYQSATPTSEAINKLEELIAWEATDKNIDVLESSLHEPSQLNLNHISGHRDGNNSTEGCPSGTVCPGINLYSQLGTVSEEVSNFACYGALSINNFTNDNTISVYPNPTHEMLFLDLNNNIQVDGMQLVTVHGKIIKETSELKMNVSLITNGFYFLKINTSNGLIIKKVIKK